MKIYFLPLFLLLVMLLPACKPTEANYKSAYDAALQKRNQKDPDEDILFGGHKQASPLGSVEQEVGGSVMQVLYAPCTLINPDSIASSNHYRVAIARYRMEANALAHAERLSAEGEKGVAVAKLGDERFIVIAYSAPSLSEAGEWLAARIKSFPESKWIGMIPPEPMILISPR